MQMSSMAERSEDRPSVCFVVTSPAMADLLTGDGPEAMGGAELQLSLLGQALKEKGWDVSFLVADFGQGRTIETEDGIRLLRAYPQSGSRSTRDILLRSLPEFWHSLREIDADVYVTRGLTGQAGVIAAFAKLYNRRYIFWFGKNTDAQYGVPMLSRLPLLERLPAWYGIHFADAVVVQTNEQGSLLRKYVRRNGVVVRNVSPWPDTTCGDWASEHALWVGSIQPKKRPHMILDIACQVPQVQFVMAGGQMPAYPDLYDTVKRRAEHTNNVDFLGFVPFDQIKELFERAGVLISTSEPEQEGFPNVFLQAWSTGTPVVATCDPDEVICRHRLGYHCESTNEMSERIQEITHSHELQKEIGQRTHQYVSEYHSLDSIMGQLDGFLRELIDDKQTAGTNQKRVLE